MSELSINKKMKIIKYYLQGYPYDENAKKSGVSKGTVFNVVSDLKAGLFPEVSTGPEEIEQLRELAIDIKRNGISPVQAGIGLSVLERLATVGIEPADIEKCHTLLQVLTPPSSDLAVMTKAILAIEDVKESTGLTLEELEDKFVSLRKEAEKLAPISEEVEARKKELIQLEKDRESLIGKVKELNDRKTGFSDLVDSLEVKESKLLNNVTELEERARAADKQLIDARRDLKTLDKIGMNLQELSKFTAKLWEVSAHHDIKPADLYHRLLKELKMLDKGLNLEHKVKEAKSQLEKVMNEIAREHTEKESLHAYLKQLTSEKTSLKAQLAHYRKQLDNDITTLSETSKKTVQEISESLKAGLKISLSEVNKLADESVRVGKEVGKLEANIESLGWIKPMLSMVRGDNGLDDYQVRVIGLNVLRSMLTWLNENHSSNLYFLKNYISGTIGELEKWNS